MPQLRDRLPRPTIDPTQTRLLGEDYRFTPARLPATGAFRVDHEAVHLLERPLALERELYLQDQGDIKLGIGFRLCWNGGADAIESLYQFVESFQREVPVERVRRISDEGIGEFGLAWSWDDPLGAEVVGLVRANLMVTVVAYDAAGLAERVARELDGELRILRLVDEYPEAKGGVFDDTRRRGASDAPPVDKGELLVLGVQPASERWFFITSRGSANRDPGSPASWYFRAPLEPGAAEIRLFRTDEGLLPVVERLLVEVR